MATILFFNPHSPDKGPTGTWVRQPDGSITSDGGAQSVLDATLSRLDGDTQAAWDHYASWSNGYAASIEVPAGTTAVPADWLR